MLSILFLTSFISFRRWALLLPLVLYCVAQRKFSDYILLSVENLRIADLGNNENGLIKKTAV